MDIRKIKDNELSKLLELYTYLHETDEPLPDEKVVNDTWSQIINKKDHLVLGVFEGQSLVSSCVLNIIPNLTRGCRPYGLIENVVTHLTYRKRGYGKAILRYAVNYARAQNCYKVMLLTGRKNEAVYSFYESAGFDRNSKQAFVIKIDDF